MFLSRINTNVVLIKGNNTPCASGVIIGFAKGEDEKGEMQYESFLCTCSHVFSEQGVQYSLCFDTIGGESTETIGVDISHRLSHPKIDMCLLPLKKDWSKEGAVIRFIGEEDMCLEIEKKFYTGDFIYTAGFPLGKAGSKSNYPIFRHGIISRLDEECLSQDYFYTDSFCFPGNSGGPVFSKPEAYSIGGVPPVKKQFLLGIVSGYIPHTESLINQQTGKTQSVLTQNSGLTEVMPIKVAKEVYQQQYNT